MKNKKFLGIPLTVMLIGLLTIGIGAAAIVSYLSNTAEITSEVQSPLLLEVYDGTWGTSANLGETFGGNTVAFSFRETNRADVDIDSDLTITVAEAGEVNSCSEITQLRFKGSDATNWNDITSLCNEVNNNLKWVLPTTVANNSQKIYDVEVTFDVYALGTYTASVQHN